MIYSCHLLPQPQLQGNVREIDVKDEINVRSRQGNVKALQGSLGRLRRRDQPRQWLGLRRSTASTKLESKIFAPKIFRSLLYGVLSLSLLLNFSTDDGESRDLYRLGSKMARLESVLQLQFVRDRDQNLNHCD
ncbi:hypothetical protein CsatA_000776 [Cannabis sativa]|uniref:Uncharacterized protein n=1 Tax=Cannabis sativa TaxID=3483 RepID=A0A803PAP5_CANSA